MSIISQTFTFFLAGLSFFLTVPGLTRGQSGKKEPAVLQMPDYQYPPQGVSKENAVKWKWMKAFYEREVSLPATADETPEQVKRRAALVMPTPEKLAYLDMELITFPHFGMSTFSGHQQGTGKEDPVLFNPTAFDAGKWVDFHKAIGAKMIVFVAQHHDGFALWPTGLNNYSIKSSPWRGGKGDMVREIADACREGGLKLGLYISLWDKHDPRCDHPRKGAEQMTPEQRLTYQTYIEQKLTETLIPYGEISELWFDGAGTNGAEDWNRIYEIVHHYQPKCLISMCGFGIRWCGNESAVGDAVNWNVLPLAPELKQHAWVKFHLDQLISKKLPTITNDLNSLRGQELFFIPQEGDTRVLNGGWHWDGVGEPRSLEFLIDTWYASVGSGANLILSPAPGPDGTFNEQQTNRLLELRNWLDKSFADNLLGGAKLTLAGGQKNYRLKQLISGDTPYCAAEGGKELSVIAEFPKPRTFNNLVVEEAIGQGQRISAFTLEAWKDGRWIKLAEGQAVGHKRVLSFSDVSAGKIRFRVTDARYRPVLKFLGLYRALPYRENEDTLKTYQAALENKENLLPGLQWSCYEDANNGFLPYQEMFGGQRPSGLEAMATGVHAHPMKAFNAVPDSLGVKKHFAMRFDGYFRAPARALYTFEAGANSGCRLYLNGKLLIENDNAGGTDVKMKSAKAGLETGLHRITIIAYFGLAGKPKLEVTAGWPGNPGLTPESTRAFWFIPDRVPLFWYLNQRLSPYKKPGCNTAQPR